MLNYDQLLDHPNMYISALKRLFLFAAFLLIFACSGKRSKPKSILKETHGKYSLIKGGKVFQIKGAAGYTNLSELRKAGGNSIRIWDTAHIDKIIQDANRNGISVIVGLPIPESKYLSHYNDTLKVNNEYQKIKKLVIRLKSNPAILMWCVGNELTFPNKPSYNNFYKAFNNLVDMIHHVDPEHPVTTTMVNFNKKDIINLRLRTDIDVISFNIFSRITELRDDLKSFAWFWNGPYMITEWAIDGPWEGFAHTEWDAKIEPTSNLKAKLYLSRYKRYIPVEDPRFLGSFIFYWGQKQETTHTWFSLFDDKGNKTEAVGMAEEIWTGKPVKYTGPVIQKIRLAGKMAADNIILEPGQLQLAEITVHGTPSDFMVNWEIYPEDWFKKNNVNNIIKPKLITNLITEESGFRVKFKTPQIEGPYRLFAAISDKKGNIATANVPFYIAKFDEKK